MLNDNGFMVRFGLIIQPKLNITDLGLEYT